jgi:hypothetical protein
MCSRVQTGCEQIYINLSWIANHLLLTAVDSRLGCPLSNCTSTVVLSFVCFKLSSVFIQTVYALYCVLCAESTDVLLVLFYLFAFII